LTPTAASMLTALWKRVRSLRKNTPEIRPSQRERTRTMNARRHSYPRNTSGTEPDRTSASDTQSEGLWRRRRMGGVGKTRERGNVGRWISETRRHMPCYGTQRGQNSAPTPEDGGRATCKGLWEVVGRHARACERWLARGSPVRSKTARVHAPIRARLHVCTRTYGRTEWAGWEGRLAGAPRRDISAEGRRWMARRGTTLD